MTSVAQEYYFIGFLKSLFGSETPKAEANPVPPPPAATDKSSEANDQKQLNQLENKASVPVVKRPPAPPPQGQTGNLEKLSEEVSPAQAAVGMARTGEQQAKFHQKALGIWQEGVRTIPPETLFGGSKESVLAQKLNHGSDIEKAQAALWVLGDEYGSMLGSFGTAGIDGQKGYFTDKALEKFKTDYQAGKFKDQGFAPDPSKPLSDQEAMARIVDIAKKKPLEVFNP